MMTRKHFEKIAAVLKATRPDGTGSLLSQWEYQVNVMATMCAEDNPRFNHTVFFEACGLEDL
jgi:hypothetical protein